MVFNENTKILPSLLFLIKYDDDEHDQLIVPYCLRIHLTCFLWSKKNFKDLIVEFNVFEFLFRHTYIMEQHKLECEYNVFNEHFYRIHHDDVERC